MFLLPKWKITKLSKKNGGKVVNFLKSTSTNSPISDSGTTSLPPVGNSFMYIETSSINHGHEKIFVSWERPDNIRISNITFYYNRFSILTSNRISIITFCYNRF